VGRLTVRLVKSLGQAVDPNDIPTLDSHSNSFVSTTGPNDFTSLTVNHPHS
jgi:hypothetical protein